VPNRLDDLTDQLSTQNFPAKGDEAASGNFVRLLEINGTTLLPQVMRYVPGVDYTLNRSSDGVCHPLTAQLL
jgi:hypothetical protein